MTPKLIGLHDDECCPVNVTWTEPVVPNTTRWTTTDNSVCDVGPDDRNLGSREHALLVAQAGNGIRECDIIAWALTESGHEVRAVLRIVVAPSTSRSGAVN